VSITTPSGLTDPFTVNNGIEQGKTLSPILWVIFYDPLVSRLSEHQTIKEYTAPNALAYMDDLALIASSKNNLENLFTTANQFFMINGLKCNKDKTKVINNIPGNSSSSREICFDNLTIPVLKPFKSVKYLGILISPSRSLQNNRKDFIQSVTNISEMLSR
jgi:hypothetical protein